MNNSYNIDNGKGDIQKSWWQRRSKMEKKLMLFSIFALIVIIILLVVLIIFFTSAPTTCLSPSCVHITNELLEHMNTSVDPCEDFYQFTCGNFIANVQLDGEPAKSVEKFMYINVEDRVQGIIEESEDENDLRSLILAKKLYKACMNQSAIEERGLRLIKDSLRQIGGWPVLEGTNWKEKEFEWKAATYKLRELGYDFEFFIVMHVMPDENEPSKYIIQIDKPYSPLYRSTDEEEEMFHSYMVNLSVSFGADRGRARNDFRAVADFQKSLFKGANEEQEEEEDDKYDPLTISELQYQFREIPWLEYINRLQFPAPNISYDQVVSVPNSAYFLRLQNMLKKTPKRVLANYIAWRTVREQSVFLTEEIWDLMKKHVKETNKYGSEFPPRPKFCSQLIHHGFPLALQSAYIRKYFSLDAKIHVTKILQSIKDKFKGVITDLHWIDEETRNAALERLASSTNYVAFPNDLMDTDKIESRYMGFQVDEENFLASVLNVRYYRTNLNFQKLHDPVEKDEELEEEYTTYMQSYYSPVDNTLTVPAGLLQGVIYDDDRPQYLNYGALGSTLGHEVSHIVFEGKGCQRVSRYYDWITAPTLLNFNKKLSCIAMHYGKYPVPEIREHLNSSNTKHEDFADIAGVKLAYEAYKTWLHHNGPEQNLPGLDYTPKQLFWISSAMRFCQKSTPEVLEGAVAHSSKSPGKYRALGTLRNSEEFSRDFNCPSNSYMNNEEKCEIW